MFVRRRDGWARGGQGGPGMGWRFVVRIGAGGGDSDAKPYKTLLVFINTMASLRQLNKNVCFIAFFRAKREKPL